MEGEVFWGNNTTTEMKGIGIVVIKTINRLTRVLTNVCHIPGLRRNMISLGVLDLKGCSVVVGNGLTNVKRNSKVMLMGRRLVICIFFWEIQR